MNRIAENLNRLKTEIADKATLVVVSKYRSIEEIQAAYDAGQRHFAENRVQALLERAEALPSDIHWHLIGHLQTNKVKYIVPFVYMIHSVDSIKLLDTIQKEAQKQGRNIPFLVQLHVAQEESKFGIAPSEYPTFKKQVLSSQYPNTEWRGLMAMATFSDDQNLVKQEFRLVKQLFDRTQAELSDAFDTLSMGMSGDYALAIEEGSNLVRVGSAVFA
jgi:pyridoxal phosphate enzyme (YggS family)